MGKLNVLFVAAWYPTKESPSAGVFIREHAKAAALYDDITVAHVEQTKAARWSRNEIRMAVEDGICTVRTKAAASRVRGVSLVSYVLHLSRILAVLRKEGWRPDIIAAQVFSAAVPSVILGRLFGIPVVVTEHLSAYHDRTLSKRAVKRAKFALERAEIVLPVSASLAGDIQEHGIHATFRVVPNVVDTRLFYPAERLEKNSDSKRILFAGLFNPRKNLPCLLRALSKLRQKRQDFVLDVVGDGAHRRHYEDMVRDLNIGEHVHFHGHKSKVELAALMRNSHFLVLPSEYETFGCVVIEAVASGIPVVVSDVGGLREFVQPSVGLRVPPGDVPALSEAIDHMLDHSREYEAAELANYAREGYSPEVIGRKLHGIYEGVMANYARASLRRFAVPARSSKG